MDSPFQYPRSDRRRCNKLSPDVIVVFTDAFSILGRIGGDATYAGIPAGYAGIPAFSILGRIGGDATLLPHTGLAQDVQPFSILGRIGGDATTQAHLVPAPPSPRPFSILGRIGGDATDPGESPMESPFAFQYPRSDRRRCNATHTGWMTSKDAFFQYPRSDRRRCNPGCGWTCAVPPVLSVSSVGSEAMQLPAPVREWLWTVGPFSILGRIGGDATRTPAPPSSTAVGFQYPRSDRRRCNSAWMRPSSSM